MHHDTNFYQVFFLNAFEHTAKGLEDEFVCKITVKYTFDVYKSLSLCVSPSAPF